MSTTHPYIPNTDEDREFMLRMIGIASADELFADIPLEFRIDGLALPPAKDELGLANEFSTLADQNLIPGNNVASFLGGGAYQHFIPSTVSHIISRAEYYTAYTPYQPEISQGTLQTMFELQSMVCELTGMDVANSGMYDGASALAEACLMACRLTKRERIAIHPSVNPDWIDVVRFYASGPELSVEVIEPNEVGIEHACFAVQQPSFLGVLNNTVAIGQAAHASGALYVVAVDPISLGMLLPPGEYGADIVVAEGQSLGWPVNFGGPWIGLFATRGEHVRQMPGRIVGRTKDHDSRTGYVLTLQTREQHIRREQATSNICTSQQLVGLAATVYLATVGKHGLRQIAETCYHKSHYAAEIISHLPDFHVDMRARFFKEFVVRCPLPPPEINRRLLDYKIIGGLDVSNQVENGLLLCVTEVNTREEIERLRSALSEVTQ